MLLQQMLLWNLFSRGALGAKDSQTCKNGSGNTATLWYKKKTSRVTIGARLSYANN